MSKVIFCTYCNQYHSTEQYSLFEIPSLSGDSVGLYYVCPGELFDLYATHCPIWDEKHVEIN